MQNCSSTNDNSLCIKHEGHSFTALLIYVDDLLLVVNDMTYIINIWDILHNSFRIKDLWKLKYFAGLEISLSKYGIHICQRKYKLYILASASLHAIKLTSTPMQKVLKFLPTDTNYLSDPQPYWRLIGKLIYLTNTRPDISFVV